MPYGHGSDPIAAAVRKALSPIVKLETQWNAGKLESRVRSYVTNAGNSLEDQIDQPWQELLLEFASSIFASVFQALSDRPWLNQVDFIPVLTVGFKEVFPPSVLAGVEAHELDRAMRCANDQAYEEQRYCIILYEIIQSGLKKQNKSQKNKVYSAFEQGRKNATDMDISESKNPIEEFASNWINCSIQCLRTECNGKHASVLSSDDAILLFNSLIENGTFPINLIFATGPLPSSWPIVSSAVQAAYFGPGSSKGCGKKSHDAEAGKPSSRSLAWSIYGRRSPGGSSSASQPSRMNPIMAQTQLQPAHIASVNGAAKGHPKCVQADVCMGLPTTELVRHMDLVGEGDVYCSTCYSAFKARDPTLKAVPYRL